MARTKQAGRRSETIADDRTSIGSNLVRIDPSHEFFFPLIALYTIARRSRFVNPIGWSPNRAYRIQLGPIRVSDIRGIGKLINERPIRVAIVHYWLVSFRGGERVVEALCNMFPQADLFTHIYAPERMPQTITRHRVRTTFVSRLPFARRWYQNYLPLMPMALEQLDLRDYDLVISSESGPAKGVLTRPDALHLCYCHTPMRYVWSMYHDYLGGAGRVRRLALPFIMHRLRQWDQASANRVDFFVANSENVARQINKYYRRSAVVVYPPVDVSCYSPVPHTDGSVGDQPYFLYIGQLVLYKRVDLAIEAFNALGIRLIVIGEGEEERTLRRMAGPTIVFLGRQDAESLRRHYSRCEAVIFPGEEDFGIVPLEAMACGRPVIAYGRGGALETVMPGTTGILFYEQTAAALIEAVKRYQTMRHQFIESRLVEHANRFSRDQFIRRFRMALNKAVEETGIELPAARNCSRGWLSGLYECRFFSP